MLNKRLLNLVPNIIKYSLLAVFLQWITLIANIIITFAICNYIVKALYKNINIKFSITTILIILICIIIRILFTKLYVTISSNNAQRAKLYLRQTLFSKLCDIGISYKDKVSTAEVIQVGVEGIDQLETYFSAYIPQLFYSLLSVITLFVIFCFISIKTAIVLIICVPIIPLSIVFVQKISKRILNKYWNSYTNLGDSFLENIQGLTTLKIYSADEIKHNEMNNQAELFRKATMKVLIMQLNSISIMDIVAYCGSAIGIVISVLELINNNISFLGAFVIILLSAEFFIPLRQLGSFFHIAMNGASAANKIFKILDINTNKIHNKTIVFDKPDISINNMSFSYDKIQNTLTNININMDSKGLYALVGVSGCGKSTTANILSGKIKGYTGHITIDGIELKSIDELTLMKNITLVSHNSYIFSGSVRYNLEIANPLATDDEMIDILQKANLWNFLQNENGLDTILLENGSNLSGGQKQRLALARALLHNTPIYIFDEITSNIDVESEENILSIIDEISKEKLVIFISHRLANIVNATNIFVFDNGTIANIGSHNELMEYDNTYSKLYNKQHNMELLNIGGESIE